MSHGQTGTPLYNIWRGMKNRCRSDKYIDHHRYKDRGITVCDEWMTSFEAFSKWANDNGYSIGLQIDRRDNSKGYYPDNCRFVNQIQNMNNRDVTLMVCYNDKNQSLSLLLHSIGLKRHYTTIFRRLQRGWSAQQAIDTPIRVGNYKRNP